MKTILHLVRISITLGLGFAAQECAFAQTTTFTYQGFLTDSGAPASGVYDLTFTLYDAASGGSVVGPTSNVVNDLGVTNGLFTIPLANFPATVFDGSDRWVQVAVRPGASTGAYTNVTPRQQITAAPYAIRALTFSGTISNAQLSGTYGSAVTISNAANVFGGSFSGNGAGLTNLIGTALAPGTVNNTALSLNSVASANIVDGTIATNDLNGEVLNSTFWRFTGNSGANPASGVFLGTADNQPLEIKVNATRALRIEPNTTGAPNMIGGSSNNSAAAGVVGVVIAGGGATNFMGIPYTNSVLGDFGAVGGGLGNVVGLSTRASFIGGGIVNMVSNASYAAITGGNNNKVFADRGAIGGGVGNLVQPGAVNSTIAGGGGNMIDGGANHSTVGGGDHNLIQSDLSTIGGGQTNFIGLASTGAGIAAGTLNMIQSNAYNATIGGGDNNAIGWNAALSTISGGRMNTVETGQGAAIGGGERNRMVSYGGHFSVIGGGADNLIWGTRSGYLVPVAGANTIAGGNGNTIVSNASFGTIAGGFRNTLDTNASYSFIGGGTSNSVQTNAFNSAIGGGLLNGVGNDSSSSTIGGGLKNIISNLSSASTIAGGNLNFIGASSANSAIGGGEYNRVADSSPWGSIGGGWQNYLGAASQASVISGGSRNTIGPNADWSAIGGGDSNTNSGDYGTVPGGDRNQAGTRSFAAGHRAKATHTGAFVWADAAEADFGTSGDNQFLIRALGGVGIGATNTAGTGGVVVPLAVRGPAGVAPSGFNGVDNPLALGSYATNNYKWIQSYGGVLALNPVGNSICIGLTNTTYTFEVNGSAHRTDNSASWNVTSDRRLKRDITSLTNSLATLEQLRPVRFRYTEDYVREHPATRDKERVGFVAQEFEQVFPDSVTRGADGYLSVDVSPVTFHNTAAIRELNEKVEEKLRQKETEITKLKQRLDAMEELLNRLTVAKGGGGR